MLYVRTFMYTYKYTCDILPDVVGILLKEIRIRGLAKLVVVHVVVLHIPRLQCTSTSSRLATHTVFVHDTRIYIYIYIYIYI